MCRGKRRYPVVFFSFQLLALLFVGGCSTHDDRLSYFNMLDDEKQTQQNKRAANTFWESVRPISTLSASHYKLGRHYQKQGKYEQAIEEFSKTIDMDAGLCKAYNGIGMSYDALKQCELARKAYELALRCEPEKAYIYNNYGYSRILCNQFEQGIALLRKAEELSADSTQVKKNLEFARLALTKIPGPDCEIPLADDTHFDLALATPRELAAYMAKAAEKQQPKVKPQADITSVNAKSHEAAASPDQPALLVPSVSPLLQPHLLVDNFEAPENAEQALPIRTGAAATANTRDTVIPVLKQAKLKEIQSQHPKTPETSGVEHPPVPLPVKHVETKPPLPEEGDTKEVAPEWQARASKHKRLEEKFQKMGSLEKTNLKKTYVEVSNGNGVTGMAGRSAELLRDYGFSVRRITNARSFQFSESSVFYREGYQKEARDLADFLPGDQHIQKVDSLGRSSIGVRVLLGNDLVVLDFPERYAHLSYIKLENGQAGKWRDLPRLSMDN